MLKTNKLSALGVVAALVGLGGCASNIHRPEIAEATPTGVFYLDLRRPVADTREADLEKKVTAELLERNCKLPVNAQHPVCLNPGEFSLYSGQVRNALWGKGPVFYGVYIPKDLRVTTFAPPSEKDGDIVRARVIPGPVSMLAYDGVIERHDDPDRACWWEGLHNYSGGVVCPKYGYDHEDLDIGKL
ncbi:MAG: hypothetical protein ACYCWA_02510 [Thiobacillus sp.]